MIAIFLAEGFEEIEALTPLDMLRRASVDAKTVSITDTLTVTGSHGISVSADMTYSELNLEELDMIIFPGGMPGAKNLDEFPFTDGLIEFALKKGIRIAAICAAPMILGHRGLLKGKRAVCYPGFENELLGADVLDAPCVTDGKITTAKGMGAAIDFSEELISLLCGKELAKKISNSIMKSN